MIPTFTRSSRALLLIGLAVVSQTVASAATITLTTNAVSGGNGGGSYTATTIPGLDVSAYSPASRVGAANTFESFCLEYGEFFNPGTPYNFSISDAATLGNGGAVAGSDPISRATAWLYSQFGTGSLASYDYTIGATRKNDNTLLQLAFWYFEGEIGNAPGLLNTPVNSGNNKFVALALNPLNLSNPLDDANGAFGVRVLNLTTSNGVNKQSQLYLTGVPDSGATLGLLALTLVGLVCIRRKMRR